MIARALLVSMILLGTQNQGSAQPNQSGGIRQTSYGFCSPNFSNITGPVTITCNGNMKPIDILEVTTIVNSALKKSGAVSGLEIRKLVNSALRENLVRKLVGGSDDERVGRLEVSLEEATESKEFRHLILTDEIETGVYAGPLFPDFESISVTDEAKISLTSFARRLAKASPKSVRIVTHLAQGCPQNLANRCSPKFQKILSTAYAHKLGMRYSESLRNFLLRAAGDNYIQSLTKAIVIESKGVSTPNPVYPDASTSNAAEWEAAARQNFVVEIKITL